MWREDRYKLNVYHSPTPGPDDCPGELFDMRSDPLEMTNLWWDAEYADPWYDKVEAALKTCEVSVNISVDDKGFINIYLKR